MNSRRLAKRSCFVLAGLLASLHSGAAQLSTERVVRAANQFLAPPPGPGGPPPQFGGRGGTGGRPPFPGGDMFGKDLYYNLFWGTPP